MSAKSSDDAALDPVARQFAGFVSGEVRLPDNGPSRGDEFARRLANLRRTRQSRRRLAAGIVIVSLLVAVGAVGLKLRDRAAAVAPLSYRVDNQEPPAGGYILVPHTTESLLAFSDGSKVRMAAQTRGRVVELNDRGAKFTLDDGKLAVDVVHRPGAQWAFEAGPFRVNVRGTSFTVAWNPSDAVFEVRLASGSVSVVSPVAGPEIQMRAGQTLKVNLRDQTSTIGTTARESGATTDDATTRPPPTTAALAPSEPDRWSHRGWMAALSENKAAAVVAEAERSGLTTVLERADGDDLWALANAARYAGRYPLAEQALAAQRRRFPSSDRAREAAFLLGRLHDGDSDGPGKALAWYDRYLAEARGGVNVADALGRKMTLLERWNKRSDALVVARSYLHRFPHGTYANAARALVGSSTSAQ